MENSLHIYIYSHEKKINRDSIPIYFFNSLSQFMIFITLEG